MTAEITDQTVCLLLTQSSPVNNALTSHLVSLGAIRDNIFFAQNGRVALDKLQQQNFDLIIADLEFPQFLGLELLKAIRTEKKLYNMPLLLLASTNTPRQSILEATKQRTS